MDYLKSYEVDILSFSQGREIHMTGAKYLTDFFSKKLKNQNLGETEIKF